MALYGIDALISTKERDKQNLDGDMTDELIRIREEVSEQIRALELMKAMAMKYGFDISQPAQSAQEAFPVALFWISCSPQRARWSGDEYRKCFFISRYFY